MAVPKARTVIRERYQLESMIGEGGMASVWRARDLTLARSVAVKLLFARDDRDRSAITARFLREARIAASVQHRNVIQIVDFGTTDDEQPFMVMELLEGEPLSGRMHRDRRLPLADVVQLANLTLRGLAAVHNAGIIHRDLKPDNIYLKRESESVYPKILDFGISRSVEPASGRRSALTTREGMIIGTPEYMSPEQARGVRDIDPRADLYSMGVILYECLTGRLPFHSVNVGDLIIQVVTGTAPTAYEVNPDIPIEISQVIERAMARKREDRFGSAGEMQAALLDAAARSELRNAPRMLSELPKFDASEASGTRPLTPTDRVTLNDPEHDPDSLITGRLKPVGDSEAAAVLEIEPESRRPTTDGLAAIPPATKTLRTSSLSMRARAARHRYALPLVASVALVYVVLMLVRSLGRHPEAPSAASQPPAAEVATAEAPPATTPEVPAIPAAPDSTTDTRARAATTGDQNVEVVVGDKVEIREQTEPPAAAKARPRNRPAKLRKTAQGALRNLDF